jgi:tRNA 2-selenouridine synthase
MFQFPKLQKTPLTFVTMAIKRLTIEEFLHLAKENPVLDVRSPGEFLHAHIPGAYNIPLFSDDERKIVGTAYKQESKEKAIKLGLDFFGVKMVKMVEEVEGLCKVRDAKYKVRSKESFAPRTSNIVLVHCWRGGMRSAGVAWLLDLYGFTVYTLVGGYKVYRKWTLQQFEKNYTINVLGGYTGSGKTETLHELNRKNEYIIDLEKTANHKGSAFGSFGQPKQPSQEMFENLLGHELKIIEEKGQTTQNNDNALVVWVEDESQRIGEVNIPTPLYRQMRKCPVYFIHIPFEERLDFIVKHYGGFQKDKLVNAIIRIKKRLGGLETKTAINYLLEDIKGCFSVLLTYYDKFYLKSLQSRENFTALFQKIELPVVSAEETAKQLLQLTKETIAQ